MTQRGTLPVAQIEEILQADGMDMDGVLTIEQDREDLHVTGPGGLPFKPAWELNNEFYFQPLGSGRAILNADLPLLPHETQPFIDRLLSGGLGFMAFHQHFFDLSPMVFFIHYRGIGDPVQLAKAAAAAVKVTGTPLPQKMAQNAKSPLDEKRLAKILGGDAQVGSGGVVNVSVPRKETIVLGGVALNPQMGVSTTIAFEPLGRAAHAAAAPDFALIASEVNPVMKTMRAQGFTVHCLYNQETDEQPQLYFSHQLATGDAYDLARKIRNGLEHTNAKFTSA